MQKSMKSIELKKSNSLKLDFLGDISEIFEKSNDPFEILTQNQKKGMQTLENQGIVGKIGKESSDHKNLAEVMKIHEFYE